MSNILDINIYIDEEQPADKKDYEYVSCGLCKGYNELQYIYEKRKMYLENWGRLTYILLCLQI